MIDIKIEIPDELKRQGVSRIEVQRNSVMIEYQEKPYRFTLTKNDSDKTIRAFEKRIENVIENQKTKEVIKFLIWKEWDQIVGEIKNSNNTSKTKWVNEYNNQEVSLDEWQNTLRDKYQNLQKRIKEYFPYLIDGFEFALSIHKILNLKDCNLPFAGILLGNPSSCKTLIIELFRDTPNTFYTDDFTARSFVSHNTSVPKEELPSIDLLPKIKNKYFLTPELAPMFAKKDEDVIQSLGIITRILDGHGYASDSGAWGHREYVGEWMFVWCGAAVDIPRKVHRYLGTLGPKLYFLRMPKQSKEDNMYLEQLKLNDFNIKFQKVRQVLFDYLKWFEICPVATVENDTLKIEWGEDEEEALQDIVKLGKLLAHLRGVIPTWETYGTQGKDYAYAIATIEEPDRAMTQLRNLARGHALCHGRNRTTLEDIPLLIKVVLSTASIERVKVFDLLISNRGILTTSEIVDGLNTTSPTARKTMAELRALGLVNEIELGNNGTPEFQIQLKDDFNWFLAEDFLKLRDGFVPRK